MPSPVFARLIPALALAGLLHAPLFAVDYYVSPGGNDANPGTGSAPHQAWRTIDRANAAPLGPGDRLLFEGGKTFTGMVRIDGRHGAQGRPITVSSYGNGRAVIASGSNTRALLASGSWIRVANIDFVGIGRAVENWSRGLHFDGVRNGEIDQVKASSFNWAGIAVSNSRNVRVTHSYATDNGYVGFHLNGADTNVYVGHCKAINNPGYPKAGLHSGSGFLAEGGPHDCLFEYNEAAHNGWDQRPNANLGPFGFWTWYASKITFQYNISHNNKTSGPLYVDGGGFDMDGGSRDCVFQYNYSYDNQGPAYLIWSSGEHPVSGGVFRYNISENDGLKAGATVRVYDAASAADIRFHNNTFYNSGGRSIVIKAVNQAFYNNIMALRGGGSFATGRLAGNIYWNYDNPGAPHPGGIAADPRLAKPGSGEKLTNPRELHLLSAYRLDAGSPCIGAGVDLEKTYGLNPGPRDFYGAAVPTGKGSSIGAAEYGAALSLGPRPRGAGGGGNRWFFTAGEPDPGQGASVEVRDLRGRRVPSGQPYAPASGLRPKAAEASR